MVGPTASIVHSLFELSHVLGGARARRAALGTPGEMPDVSQRVRGDAAAAQPSSVRPVGEAPMLPPPISLPFLPFALDAMELTR